MKTHKSFPVLIFLSCIALLICVCSCKKDKTIQLNDFIIAGQRSAEGINYVDVDPDIIVAVNPWEKQDTTILIDVNKDGTNDFEFKSVNSYPGMLGMGYASNSVAPVGSNELCIIEHNIDTIASSCQHSTLQWIDTLSFADTINKDNLWTTDGSLLGSNKWFIQECSITDGLWWNVVKENDKYIGFKLVKSGKNYFGWIGLYMIGNSYIITDYAITREY